LSPRRRRLSGTVAQENMHGELFSAPSSLDFAHWERTLNAEQQVCKLLLTLPPKEAGNACRACHSDTPDCTVRAPVFQHVWAHAHVVLVGALHPRQTYREAVLRVLGLSLERHLQNSHRVLQRARWSGLRRSGCCRRWESTRSCPQARSSLAATIR